MSKSKSVLKNVFSSFVATATVLSSVFGSLGFAQVASAAVTGDLIKASGPAVYYYAADGKRYVFPNEKTYFSWYTDFSAVKTISDSELANIAIGGNVTVRPGTKLVKITTDPKVYAVTKNGTLHWIESEAIAKSLYGDMWAGRVVDVPDPFFVNYMVGSSVASAVHPDGQVVQYAGDSNWYVVWNGQKRKFASDAAFMANGYNKADAVMTTISYPSGADVAGREADLADTVITSGVVPTGAAVTVSLASDTPAGMTVTLNAASVPLAKYNFSAGLGGATITGLTVHRVGIGAAANLSNIYLYDANGMRLTTGRTVNSTSHTATFSSLKIAVPAGGMTSVLLYGDFGAASSGGQHSFEIVDPASVVVTGGSTVQGSFPVRGNVFTVGNSSSGRLDVLKGAQPGNPTVGSSDVEVSNFKLAANTNDLRVSSITLYQAGTITNSDLTMLKLYQGNTMVAEAASVDSSGRIYLKFTSPYLITNGTTKVFSLRAKVGGRSGRTIRTYVEYTTDVNAMDTVFNTGAAVDIATNGTYDGSGFTAGTTGCDTPGSSSCVVTQGGTLTNAFNGPATSNVAKGQLAVPLYKFALTSADNDLEIRNVRLSIATTAGAAGCAVVGSASTAYFRNIKLVNTDTGLTWMGPKEISGQAANSDTSGTMTFSDTQTIKAGKTVNLAVAADLSNSEDGSGQFFTNGDCGYKVTLAAFQSNDIRVIDTGEFLALSKVVPNSAVTGNQMTVKASNLTISLAGSSGTVVKKQSNVKLASIVLNAGAQSDVLVTSLTVTCQAALATSGSAFGSAAALANCSQRVTSLSLMNGSSTVGVLKAPDSTSGAAQISNMNLTIPAGGSVTLDVKAVLSSTASTTSPFDQVSVGVALAADVSAQDKDANTVTPTLGTGVAGNANGASPSIVQTIRNSGTITVQADSMPQSTIVVAGKDVWVPFAQYKATSQFEDLTLDRIAFLASSTAGFSADNADFTAIAIASNNAVKGWDVLSVGTTGTKDVDLTANPITVPKDGSVNFQLWAKLAMVQASGTVSGATTGVARSGHVPALGMVSGTQTGEWDSNYANKLNIRATGAASGERVYAAAAGVSHGNAMVLRKTKPVVVKQSLSSTTLANTDQDLFKFQVTADTQGSVALKQVVFNLAKTSGVTLSNFRLRKGVSDMALADLAVTYVSSTAQGSTVDAEASSIGTTQNAGFVVVSFTSEESLSPGESRIYTLHASVSGAVAGQNMSLSFYRDPSATVGATGYLSSSGSFGNSASVYNLDTGAAPTAGLQSTTGTFVWSDNSENPHSTAIGTSSGSRDWSNDVYVDDLSSIQTLSL